jgi:peptidylprolyl isomerase
MYVLAVILAAAAAAAPLQPDDIVAAAPASAWQAIAPENLMLVETAAGTMAVELAPDFAPEHVAAIRSLVAAGRFDGGAITRVQDNYVVQWAVKPETGKSGVGQPPADRPPRTRPRMLPPEYERPLSGLNVTPLGSPDAYADAGFANGWPIGFDKKTGTAWLAHCYGMVGAGRDMPPDTGDSSELYAVIGHGPRHLDRNIAVVGRVISGIEPHAALKRGTADLGFYATPAEQTAITRVRMANTVPGAPKFTVLDTTSPSFIAYKDARANRTGFFVRPAGAVDLCNVRVPVRLVPSQ